MIDTMWFYDTDSMFKIWPSKINWKLGRPVYWYAVIKWRIKKFSETRLNSKIILKYLKEVSLCTSRLSNNLLNTFLKYNTFLISIEKSFDVLFLKLFGEERTWNMLSRNSISVRSHLSTYLTIQVFCFLTSIISPRFTRLLFILGAIFWYL